MSGRGGGFDRGGRGGGGDRGGRGGGDRGGRGGGDRGGRGGGDFGGRGGRGGSGADVARPEFKPLDQMPSVSVKTLPLVNLGKGAVMPLLFGGYRTGKPAEFNATNAAAASSGPRGAKSAPKDAAALARIGEEREARRKQFEETRKQVDEAIENVKSLKGSTVANDAPEMTVNCFPVKCDLQTSFYQYQVVTNPEVFNRRAKRILVDRALAQVVQKYKAPMPIQSNNLIFSVVPIHNTKAQDEKDKVETVEVAQRERKISVSFKFTRTFENAKGLSTETYSVLSTVLREAFDQAGMIKIGGKYFDTDEKYSKSITVQSQAQTEALQVASGLNITLYPTSRGLMLNIDLAMRVARKENCLTTIKACKAFAEKNRFDWKEVVRNEFVGAIAASTYSVDSRKQTFSIVEVRFDVNPETVMPGDPNKTTFAKYMKEHHNKDVTDKTQPMLLFRSQREVDREGKPLERWYIPEFTKLVGQSNKMRADASLQQDLKRACLLSAEERFGYITMFVNKIAADAAFQSKLQGWKMSLDNRITKVPIKRFGCPQLTLRTDENRRAWNVNQPYRAANADGFKEWAVVSPDRLDQSALGNFLGSLTNQLGQLGLKNVTKPQLYQYRSDRDPGRWGKNLSDKLGELPETIQFVVVVLNDNNEQNYFLVKEVSLKDWNIPSQCVLMRNAQTADARKLDNITSRIAGQMIVKMGGALWALQRPIPNSDGILIVGLSIENAKGCTAISLVAARAENMCVIANYAGSFNGPAGPAIETGLNKILETFKRETRGKAPSALFVYRPGMNEGDIPKIISDEVIPVQKICTQQKIGLIFINALKRCSIRFMPAQPGSYLDDFLTPTVGFTFMIVPQQVTQGCATAMKFSVLSNSAPNVTGELIEQITFNQCHMFYGWWGATREPAVVMYSERNAEMHANTAPKEKAMPYIENGGVRVL